MNCYLFYYSSTLSTRVAGGFYIHIPHFLNILHLKMFCSSLKIREIVRQSRGFCKKKALLIYKECFLFVYFFSTPPGHP